MTYRALASAAVGLMALGSSGALAGGPGCETCYRHVVQPPVYGTVQERVLVRAPRTYEETLPGEYRTVAETVLVSPERKVWQVGRDAYGQTIGCWVTVPAQYAVRHRTVMVRAPQVVQHTVPAVFGVQNRTVLVQPARSGWQPIHAGYPAVGRGYVTAGTYADEVGLGRPGLAGIVGAGVEAAAGIVGAGVGLVDEGF